MYPYAKYASEKLGGKIPPEAILGQWAGESGNGKSLGADFNYAGIKAKAGQPKGDFVLTEEAYSPKTIEDAQKKGGILPGGESLVRVLDENSILKKTTKSGKTGDFKASKWYASWYDKLKEGKVWVQIRSYFAKYKDPQEFTDAYVKVLSLPRYKKARESTDASSFGFEVAKAGYATAGAQKYSEKVAGFVNQNAELLSNLSKENANVKRETSAGQPTVIIAPQTNTNRNTTRSAPPSQPNVNPMLGR
jgi:hypothetical protein